MTETSSMTLDAAGWMLVIGLGGMIGALGQVIRAVGGLRKMNEDAAAKGATATEVFSASRLIVSILIGATAGALAAIAMPFDPHQNIPANLIIALLGAGYAGADFVEAFMEKALPQSARAPASGTGPVPASPQAAPQPESGAPPRPSAPSEKQEVYG